MLLAPKINTYFTQRGDFLKLRVAESAISVIAVLESAGYEAFCVGGAVRDLLMGKVPTDYDIATNATPQEVMKLFPKTITTGIKHGTVTVLHENDSFEITTYRTEQGYADGRHPDSVNFVGNIEEDLARRDFTMNAIAYSPTRGIIDPFGGAEDIERGVIRCVGQAQLRFSEDYLRIMRCFRFAATLGFGIEESTLTAALKLKDGIKNVSRERIFTELWQMLCGSHLCLCAPLFEIENVGVISRLNSERHIRFAAYCILSQAAPVELCSRLKTSSAFAERVADICAAADFASTDVYSIRQAIISWGETDLVAGLEIQEIIYNKDITEIKNAVFAASKEAFPKSIVQLEVGGGDLISLGLDGADIGRVLNALHRAVLKGHVENKHDALIAKAKDIISR